MSMFECHNEGHYKPHSHQLLLNQSNVPVKFVNEPRILLFSETQHSHLGKSITELLVANRIK